jgi:LemA protein
MKKALIVLAVIVGLGVIIGGSLVGSRNRFVAADENVNTQWSEVDTQIQRRADLIPNLVNTVKGFAAHESDVFIKIADARAQLAGAHTIPEKISANNNMDSALSRLLVVVENYPQLKSDKNFIALQDELSGTENRIAVARRNYNLALQNYNTMVRTFPGNIAASLFGFQKKDAYFQASESAQAVPQVNF